MLCYKIRARCDGPSGTNLFLTANASNSTVIATEELPGNDNTQLWVPVWVSNGVSLVNVATDSVIVGGDEVPVGLTSVAKSGGTDSAWNYIQDTGAWQLASNTDLNLNIHGDPPYANGTVVYAWGWGGGDPNESWDMIAVLQ